MFHRIKPRALCGLLGWPATLLLVGAGCANPPALDATGGSTTFRRIGGIAANPPRTAALVVDRGVRSDAAAAGAPFAGLNEKEQQVFLDARDVFKEVDSVEGKLNADEEGGGLGPTFNAAGCAECHSQPAVGGTSPHPLSPQTPKQNPQMDVSLRDGARNSVPFFVAADGPAREARFRSDGGVHGLFTIGGRIDAMGCNLQQPDFAMQDAAGNLSFRIPTPIFGLGLVETTPDAVLEANLADNIAKKQLLGIGGTFNRSGNDGTITRFGWKAQNKSLAVFAGEAYNVEQGVANELFTNERLPPGSEGCIYNSSPEDHTNNNDLATGNAVEQSSDVIAFAIFMRLSAPPAPVATTDVTQRGADLFHQVGCDLCHSASLRSGRSPFTGMSNFAYHPYSDFAIHHMGADLADGIGQGAASSDMFRTSPLWGAGQRLFFLHDGRTSDLGEAIEFHDSPGSEAHLVVEEFNALGANDQQALLDFLRSL
jgi:CxxC motif-containing protein (DUF1111 family)